MYNPQSSSLCNFINCSLPSAFSGQNILFCTLFSDICNLCCFVKEGYLSHLTPTQNNGSTQRLKWAGYFSVLLKQLCGTSFWKLKRSYIIRDAWYIFKCRIQSAGSSLVTPGVEHSVLSSTSYEFLHVLIMRQVYTSYGRVYVERSQFISQSEVTRPISPGHVLHDRLHIFSPTHVNYFKCKCKYKNQIKKNH
jgi:hypothetical protein